MDATIEYGTPGWYLLRRMSWGGRSAGRRREEGGSEAAILPDAAYLPLNRIGDARGDAPPEAARCPPIHRPAGRARARRGPRRASGADQHPLSRLVPTARVFAGEAGRQERMPAPGASDCRP